MPRSQPLPLPFVTQVEPYLPGDFAADGVRDPVKLSSNESLLGPSAQAVKAYENAAAALANRQPRMVDFSRDLGRRKRHWGESLRDKDWCGQGEAPPGSGCL